MPLAQILTEVTQTEIEPMTLGDCCNARLIYYFIEVVV